MADKRRRAKGRWSSGRFGAFPESVHSSAAYRSLSGNAVKLLIDLFMQFKGQNNGDLSCAWQLMEPCGWRSRDTLDNAKDRLLDSGLIELTRQGGRNLANLYAVTWLGVDECGGKLEVPPNSVPTGLWKQYGRPANVIPISVNEN